VDGAGWSASRCRVGGHAYSGRRALPSSHVLVTWEPATALRELTVAVEGSGRWRLATTVVTGERPPRGVDGGRSRLRVDISDCACQAGNQAEVDEKARPDDGAAAVRCSRIEAAVRR
jgi:hypothetical protein